MDMHFINALIYSQSYSLKHLNLLKQVLLKVVGFRPSISLILLQKSVRVPLRIVEIWKVFRYHKI